MSVRVGLEWFCRSHPAAPRHQDRIRPLRERDAACRHAGRVKREPQGLSGVAVKGRVAQFIRSVTDLGHDGT